MRKFMKWLNDSPAAMRYVMATSVIAMVYFVLQKMHHRDGVADFRVYYDAAKALWNGSQVYGIHFGVDSGFYKYSPFAALPFIPLTLLPYSIASGLYYFFVLFSFIIFSLVLVYHIEQSPRISGKKRGWALLFITLFLADHFERELHIGNVNVFLLILSFLVFLLMTERKILIAGILYGFILLYKPHFIILFPYFFWRREYKLIVSAMLFFGVGLLLPALLKGWYQNMELLGQWIEAMRAHNVRLDQSPNTIYGIYNRFILSPLNFESSAVVIIVLLAVTALLIVWMLVYNHRNLPKEKYRFTEYFTLIALIPNLTHTDTEHFMWTWPLIALSVLILLNEKIRGKNIFIAMLILAFVPYCVNSPDIVGRRMMLLFDESGLLGLANLIIIAVALSLFYQITAKKNQPLQT
ncbi:MAG: DUF2029 domain-containing protein [Crocinitomicaceae bacterium]|nr:DUF2029 domain-containing protein [Crocinitomicaceae bacterium]